MRKTRSFLFLAIFFCSSIFVLVKAQDGAVSTPNGTSLNGGNDVTIVTDQDAINKSGPRFRVPPGRFIKLMGFKSGYEDESKKEEFRETFLVLDDGSLYSYTSLGMYVPFAGVGAGVYFEPRGHINLHPDSLRKFIGDDLYTFAYGNVYVSRGSDPLTWDVDTAGLAGAPPSDVALDSAQTVYLATEKGLFKQTHTGSTWHVLPGMTKAVASVFLDRTSHWLYVGTQNDGIYVSPDLGATWQVDSVGMGTTVVASFSDDALGNIYATIAPSFGPFGSTGSQLYRSSEGVTTWVHVNAGLSAKSASGSINIKSVWGDSILSAATDIGLYTSTDQGSTWSDANAGIEAENAYGFLKLPSGRIITTTDLGVFTRDAGTGIWTKTLPTSGYQRFSIGSGSSTNAPSLQRDKNGVLYTSNVDNIYKSTDGGTTWSVDAPGIGGSSLLPVVPGILFVDENGIQHYAPPQIYALYLANQVYVKSGSSWVADQTGLTVSVGDRFFGYASDWRGNLFLYRSSASNVQVARRPIGGGTWIPDTSGLSGKALMSMVRGRDGTMYGGGLGGGLYHRMDSTWSKVATPAPISSNDVAQLSIDSTGAIFAALQIPGSFPVRARGVYFSNDGGASWTHAGLDSVLIRGLVSSGDSTYALTVDRGVSLLRSSAFAFLQFNATVFAFDTVSVGQSKDIQIAFTNTGTDTLKISAVTSGNGLFSPQQTTATVNPQQSTGIAVKFTPSSAGAFAGSIKIASNSSHSPDSVYVTGIAISTSSVQSAGLLPKKYSLDQNYPNPFNPTTAIQFSIPKLSIVNLKIYDLLGREVETLVSNVMNPGFYHVTFDASKLASGIYFYRLKAGNFTATKKLVLLK